MAYSEFRKSMDYDYLKVSELGFFLVLYQAR